ncbi:MAG: hypothetical protein AAFV93_01205 [Chloroflexota bacterium]
MLTHDERITKHIAERLNDNKEYSGVIIAPNHLQGEKGIGVIVRAIVQLDTKIKAGTKTVLNSVYNRLIYIS